ncbi:hypothetical protein SLS56_010806 [Neofusicoccum ribis]|uniref:Xylanolytic transcriptional activator regulatory domain-containing protein n=1 Tax=Neofusicoccum ribis TaxID=45134 RepID=A0ABR3SDG5_9PEZI
MHTEKGQMPRTPSLGLPDSPVNFLQFDLSADEEPFGQNDALEGGMSSTHDSYPGGLALENKYHGSAHHRLSCDKEKDFLLLTMVGVAAKLPRVPVVWSDDAEAVVGHLLDLNLNNEPEDGDAAYRCGLHQLDNHDQGSMGLIDADELEEWRHIWWFIYCLDSYSNIMASTPFLIEEESVCTALAEIPTPMARNTSECEASRFLHIGGAPLWQTAKAVVDAKGSTSNHNMHIITTALLREASSVSRLQKQSSSPCRITSPRSAWLSQHEWWNQWERSLEYVEDVVAVVHQWDTQFCTAVDPAVCFILAGALMMLHLHQHCRPNKENGEWMQTNKHLAMAKDVLMLLLRHFADSWDLPHLLISVIEEFTALVSRPLTPADTRRVLKLSPWSRFQGRDLHSPLLVALAAGENSKSTDDVDGNAHNETQFQRPHIDEWDIGIWEAIFEGPP